MYEHLQDPEADQLNTIIDTALLEGADSSSFALQPKELGAKLLLILPLDEAGALRLTDGQKRTTLQHIKALQLGIFALHVEGPGESMAVSVWCQ